MDQMNQELRNRYDNVLSLLKNNTETEDLFHSRLLRAVEEVGERLKERRDEAERYKRRVETMEEEVQTLREENDSVKTMLLSIITRIEEANARSTVSNSMMDLEARLTQLAGVAGLGHNSAISEEEDGSHLDRKDDAKDSSEPFPLSLSSEHTPPSMPPLPPLAAVPPPPLSDATADEKKRWNPFSFFDGNAEETPDANEESSKTAEAAF